MNSHVLVLICALIGNWVSSAFSAEPPFASIRKVTYHGYTSAIEIELSRTRAVICPEVGGRVLEFSVNNKQALFLDDVERQWKPGDKPRSGAGRFDYGPELTVKPLPKMWSGEWKERVELQNVVHLISPTDDAGIGVQREFELFSHNDTIGLSCKQTLTNVSQQVQEVCHWGRSFSPAGGICVIPLGNRPSRFPSKYAMYEEGTIINVKPTDENIRERDGFIEILAPPRKPKLGFDTYATWLAYLMPNDTVFVKRFPTFPDRVYNEAAGLTLSVWSPKGPQIELEPIGPREVLKPGDSASFTEVWYLLSFPFPKAGEKVDLQKLTELVGKQTERP